MMNEDKQAYQPPFVPHPEWASIVPQTVPWSLQPSPSVVHFTGGGDFNFHPVKRKMCSEFDGLPTKQFISEEKMAAHLSNLHISETEMEPPTQEPSTSKAEQQMPRLYVCEEVRKLKTEPAIPSSILNKIERPQMALVLWKPPAGDLGAQLREIAKEKDKKEEDVGINDMNEVTMELDTNMKTENDNQIFRPIEPAPSFSGSTLPTPIFGPFEPSTSFSGSSFPVGNSMFM